MKQILLFALMIIFASVTQAQVKVAGPVKIAGPVTMGSAGGNTFSFVSAGAQTPSCTSTTATCTITYTPIVGNWIHVFFVCNDTVSSDNPTITTDNVGNVYTQSFLNASDGSARYEKDDYLVAAGAITTIIVHCGASTTATNATLGEYNRTSGTWTVSAATSPAFGTSTTGTSASVTPSAGVPTIVIGCFVNKADVNPWITANTTIRASANDSFHGEGISSGEQLISISSGSYTASATTTNSVPWTVIAYPVK